MQQQPDFLELLEQDTVDVDGLRSCGITGFGDITNGLRARIYSLILDAIPLSIPDGQSDYHHQFTLDVPRTYGQLVSPDVAVVLRKRLLIILDAVFVLHPELQYYQGFHDVISLLIIVIDDDEMVLGIIEKLASTRFRPLLYNFDEATFNVKKALEIVNQIDEELGNRLLEANCDGMFAFSWYITWFIHVIPDVEIGIRLLDFFICCSDDVLINFISAVIISNREAVFGLPEIDYGLVHMYFSAVPSRFDIKEIQQLMKKAIELEKEQNSVIKEEVDVNKDMKSYIYIVTCMVLLSSVVVFLLTTTPE
ncbi:Rab-GAP TBC domain-containing protein [Entamoeba marina]